MWNLLAGGRHLSAGGGTYHLRGGISKISVVSISWRVVSVCWRAVPIIQGVTHINCKAFRCLSLHHICGRSRTPLVYRRGRHFVGQAERGAMAPMALPWIRHCRHDSLRTHTAITMAFKLYPIPFFRRNSICKWRLNFIYKLPLSFFPVF